MILMTEMAMMTMTVEVLMIVIMVLVVIVMLVVVLEITLVVIVVVVVVLVVAFDGNSAITGVFTQNQIIIINNSLILTCMGRSTMVPSLQSTTHTVHCV